MAKATGVGFCLAGVVVIAFYVGPTIHPLNHHRLFHPKNTQSEAHSQGAWIKGTFLLFFANTAWSLWLVMQVYSCTLIIFVVKFVHCRRSIASESLSICFSNGYMLVMITIIYSFFFLGFFPFFHFFFGGWVGGGVELLGLFL